MCMAESKFFPSKLLKKTALTHDMWEFVLEKPVDFVFQAGQFVQFLIPDASAPQAVLRSYSIASAPTDETLMFCIKMLPEEKNGKASKYLPTLNLGDTITFRGPEGRFVVAPESVRPKVFVATGSGIAPIRAMLYDEIFRFKNESLHLLFGVRSQHDVFWKEEFDDLCQQSKSFSYSVTLSQPENGWSGARGRVTEHLTTLPADADWYLCGSLPMVKDVRAYLTQAGVPSKQIHFEIF